MVADIFAYCYTKKFKKTGQGHICVVFKRKGRSQNDTNENDVLTDDELVFVRGILRKSKHACLFIKNEYPRGFRLLNHT